MPFAIAPADQDQRGQIHGRGEIEPTVDFTRDSPDDSRTGVNIRAFPALQQD
jgi:hypothetical protein